MVFKFRFYSHLFPVYHSASLESDGLFNFFNYLSLMMGIGPLLYSTSLSLSLFPSSLPPSLFLCLPFFLPPLNSCQLKQPMSLDTLSSWNIRSSNHRKLTGLIQSQNAESSKGSRLDLVEEISWKEMSHPLFSVLALERLPGECHWTPNLTFQWYLIWE